MNLPAAQQQPQTGLAAQPRQQFDLSPQTFEQAIQFCDYLAESDLVPKDFKGKPANCLIAIQWGAELGLKPLQALQNLAIINGRPALWGDAVIALVRSSPLCEYITEADDGGTAVCRVKRRGESEEVRTFSMDDAKVAGLLGKSGPWTQYPKRMRQMRARAFALTEPVDTITTRDRLALVTVHIQGVPYVIVDIGLRMLKPHELFRAQGFPTGYIIDRTADDKPLKTTAQVRMVGNSVSPPPLRALAEANLDPAAAPLAEAA